MGSDAVSAEHGLLQMAARCEIAEAEAERLAAECAALRADRDALRVVLESHGHHFTSCRAYGWLVGVPGLRAEFPTCPSCDCGLAAALSPPEDDPEEGR